MFAPRSVFNTQPTAAAGGGSAYLNWGGSVGAGGGSMLQIVSPPTALVNYNASSAGYTLDYWCYVPNWGNVTTGTGFGIGNLTQTSFQYWSIGIYNKGTNFGGLTTYFFGSSLPTQSISTVNISPNTWFHVAANFAVTGSNVVLTLYLNGIVVFTSNSVGVSTGFSTATPFSIGPRNGYSSQAYFDEIRVSNVARYTGNFTPPTIPYTSDINTLLLMHCDGTSGQSTFTDSSNTPKTITQQTTGNPAVVNTTISKF